MLLVLSLAIEAAVFAVVSTRIRFGHFNILTSFYVLWTGIFLVIAWNPLMLVPVGGAAALIMAVGMLAVLGGAVLATQWIKSDLATHQAVGLVESPRIFRWTVGLIVASVGLAVGVLAFRNSIVAAAGSTSFGQLTAEQVRYYQDFSAASHPGLGTALFALAPLVAAGGIVLGRHRKFGYLFTVYAIVMSAQNPGRTLVIDCAVTSVLCWLYYKPVRASSRSEVQHRWRRFILVAAALVCLVGYFQYEGDLLKKSNPEQIIGGTKVPLPFFSVIIYLTGEPEALSAALTENVDPTMGEHGRTVWIVPRLLSFVDSGINAPNTVAQPVLIPYSYNVYSWTGDLWFDFGWPGVVLGGLFLGLVTIVIDDFRARRSRSALWTWWGAAWGTLLLSSFIAFEFFWLNSLIYIVGGLLVFGRPRLTRLSPAATATLSPQPLGMPAISSKGRNLRALKSPDAPISSI